jgi:NAD+ synthase (glutamine-hydrolysing)
MSCLLFDIAPSAELRSNQIDPMKWGYHDALIQTFNDFRKTNPETILRWYREGTLCKQLQIDPSLLNKYSLNNPRVFIDDLEWVVRSMQKAVFKRIQAPPIIILSRNCYGYDIRESQLPIGFTENFHFLKEKILSTGTGK